MPIFEILLMKNVQIKVVKIGFNNFCLYIFDYRYIKNWRKCFFFFLGFVALENSMCYVEQNSLTARGNFKKIGQPK